MTKKLSIFVLTALLLSLIVVPISAADDTPEGVAVQGTPTIDGTIDDIWANVPTYQVDRLKDGRDTGLKSQFRVMWQPGALYVLIEVNDFDHNFDGGPSVGDGMEVYFDLNNLKTAGFEDDLQAYFAMCADDETYLTYDGSSYGSVCLQDAATVAMMTTDDKYVYEAQILMEPMETELKAGQVIGFDIQVNDQVSGDTERSGAYGWSDDVNNAWQGTMLYGNLTLTGANSEAEVAGPTAVSSGADDPGTSEDTAAKMFTDFESYPAFDMGGDPVYAMDDPGDVADYWTGNWDSMGDNGDDLTVEIRDGVGYNGTKGLALSSSGTSNVGLYLYATDKNGIAKSYPGAGYLRVWMDLSEVGFRKANFGVVNSLACLFTTDEVDAAWECPFWYSSDGTTWTEMAHGGDGCFGDAQDSDVFGLKGFFAFPVKDFTIRSNANWEAYDEQTPCDTSDVWGIYLFWDYSDNYIDNQGKEFYIDNIEFVGDYKVLSNPGTPAAESAPEVTYPASGADGSIINGTVIGNATGWGDNAEAGAAAAFDGNPATFFDPLGVGDGFCGIDAGESYILDKVVILSRADWNARFPGAMIQGSNDGETWTTLWTSDAEGTNPDYYTVTDFENNTGYSQFRYFNETNHGDVAEVEFYGKPGTAAPAPGFGTADEAVASIGKTAISGYTFTEGSNGNNNEGPENIWDGDTATKFCTGEFPISSVAELDDWYKIDGIVMATANDNAEYNGRLPSAWTVSGSPDGENWTVIASGDESFFEESNFRYFAGDASSDAIKFVKFDADGASSGCFQISELVLTGSKTAAPAADEALDAKEEAPNTFDFGVIAAIAAVVSLGGFAVSKKRH